MKILLISHWCCKCSVFEIPLTRELFFLGNWFRPVNNQPGCLEDAMFGAKAVKETVVQCVDVVILTKLMMSSILAIAAVAVVVLPVQLPLLEGVACSRKSQMLLALQIDYHYLYRYEIVFHCCFNDPLIGNSFFSYCCISLFRSSSLGTVLI